MFLNKLLVSAILVLALGSGLIYRSGAHATRASAPPPAASEAIRALIKQLGDDSFEKRESASKRLVAIGAPALDLLRQAVRDSRDAEVRQRAAQAVRAIERTLLYEVRRFTGHGAGSWVGRVAVTPDGRHAVSVGGDCLRCWDLAAGKQVLTFGARKSYGWALAISADGRRVVAGGSEVSRRDEGVTHVYDLRTGKELRWLVGHKGPIWGAALSADGKRAVTGAWDRSLRLWDVETGKTIRPFTGVSDNVRCLALSPDGKFVVAGHFAVGGKPATVRLWDVATGKEVRSFTGHTQEVSSVAFFPDGKRVLSSGFDGTIRLWDVSTGNELKRFTGHTHRVEYAALTPDGRRVVSCGNEYNPTIRVWDVASGKQLLESEPVPAGFLCVAVLPDGRQCVTTGKDGVVRLWRWAR
jgi:WD40 repeat protein